MRPNPRIMRSLINSELTGNDHLPVDTLNSNIICVDNLPSLPNPKKRKLVDLRGKRRASYQLRFLYLALENWTEQHPGCELAFVTVNFSEQQEQRLIRAKKGPAGAFSDQLQKAFRKLMLPVNFFLVIEKGKQGNKRLHAHVVISCIPDMLVQIESMLKRYTSGGASGVDIRDHYELKIYAKPGSFERTALEMDMEYGDCSYTPKESEWFENLFVKRVPMNIGVADYMSKQLEASARLYKGKPFYAPQSLRRIANELYARMYERQQELKKAGTI